VSQGFADSIEEKATKAKNAWDLTAYAKAPLALEEVEEPAEKASEPNHNERRLALLERTA
jgi:hypothetical protein